MEKVKDILLKLENDNNIEILFAVEAGSRAWGFESTDSDFDIRFVFKQKDYRKYLSLDAPIEVIDGFSEDRLYDWQGWDIKKALNLLRQSNPTLIEWIYSPVIYHSDNKFQNRVIQIVEKVKPLKPLLHHYRSFAKKNFMNHIDNQTEVSFKKYLYAIRPAGMVIWLLQKNRTKYMNIDFNYVFEEIKEVIGKDCADNIQAIVKGKKDKCEKDKCARIGCIDKMINDIISDTKNFNVNDNSEKIEINECNQILYEYFGIN